jgi:serine/threonine protein kinase
MGNTCCKETEVMTDTSYELTIHTPQQRYINEEKLIVESKSSRSMLKLYDKVTEKVVTCKRMKSRKRRRAKREANILEKFNSDYFPKYTDFYEDDEHCNLLYTFIPGSDLFCYLFSNPNITTLNEVKLLIIKMIDCLIDLHNYNLCHLDIKFENYIYHKDTDKLTLIDFESAHPFPNTNGLKMLTTYVGTKSYAAPEIWLNYYHKNSDIWSIGVCVWSIMVQQYPFNIGDLLKNSENFEVTIRKKCLFPKRKHKRIMKELKFSDDLIDFLSKTLHYTPSKRMSLTEIKNHNWLTLIT